MKTRIAKVNDCNQCGFKHIDKPSEHFCYRRVNEPNDDSICMLFKKSRKNNAS